LNKITIHNILKKYWGYKSFRTKQEAIINDILDQKDTLALLPTGGGKSICYQIPAIVKDGICIVVSPLVALMKDQTIKLQKRNISAIALTGGLNQNEIDIALDNCIYGDIKLLYVSPERLESDIVRERIKKMNLNLIAVDEAHCISHWGYDFRPSYLKIAEIRALKPDTPILALTATATKKVAKDIQDKLLFKKQNLIKNSFKRTNLAYMALEESHKSSRVHKILSKIKGPAIIYVRSRKKTYEFSSELNKLGVSSTYYHAGLSENERTKNQQKWMNNTTRVMVATNAFGMGIDKPDVRLVIHLQNPDTTEAYFQEAGRAGRDGKNAFAISLFQKSDFEDSINRFKETYPSSSDVRMIYQNLADFLQIAIGDGFEQTYDFEFEKFCSKYQLNKYKCIRALNILENDKLVLHNSYNHFNSSVKVIYHSKFIINYKSANSKKKKLLKLILRLYPGIFDNPIEIKEKKLANHLQLNIIDINKILNELNQEELIVYKKRNNTSKITFCSARYDSKFLPISKFHFNHRKSLLKKKLKHINDYLLNTSICRSKVLLDYFGEQQTEDCEICDICISKKANSKEFRNKIRIKLLENVRKNPIDISTFIARYSKIKEQVILDEINNLISEELLLKTGKILKSNE
tara:strand:- start:3702 stop:5606 length:1905 start_codon:yes stop_codon:yes gene_type:complete